MEVRLIGRNLWDEVKECEQKRRLGIEKINNNFSSKKKKKYIYIFIETGEKGRRHIGRNERKDKRGD
jgi:hypothetical protein